ncbi:hypothetical protein ACJX0J_013036, partial [Zea mays]
MYNFVFMFSIVNVAYSFTQLKCCCCVASTSLYLLALLCTFIHHKVNNLMHFNNKIIIIYKYLGNNVFLDGGNNSLAQADQLRFRVPQRKHVIRHYQWKIHKQSDILDCMHTCIL